MTTAAICTIGDELLAGEITDRNSAWLAAQLMGLGIEVRTTVSVGDRIAPLVAELQRLVAAHDVVLCSGGLGPTSDDRTREAIAAAAGVELELRDELADQLRAWFAERGVDMPERNLQQAHLPVGAEVLPPQGTAPGFVLDVGGTLVGALPGVPWELHAMYRDAVEPRLVDLDGIEPSVTRVVRVSGLGESACAEVLAPLEDELPEEVDIAYLASGGELRVKLTARGRDRDEAVARTDGPLERAVELLGEHVVAVDTGSLEETLIARCTAAGVTVAVAESASGGILADRLVRPSGASAVFLGGVVAYSAAAKRDLVGVDAAVLEEHGTVSRATTEAMAVAIRERLGATFGLATTGVAGEEPVEGHEPGTLVWAVATPDGVRSWQRSLPGDRATVRRRLAQAALEGLRRAL